MTIQRLENVGIVVDDLDLVAGFFVDLGMTLIGKDTVEGDWVDRVVGLDGVRCHIAMLQTRDGHGRLELLQYDNPPVRRGEPAAPQNTLGIRRLAFNVDNLDAAVASVRSRGCELAGEIVQYGDMYRLCYVTGPEGIVVMLAEDLG